MKKLILYFIAQALIVLILCALMVRCQEVKRPTPAQVVLRFDHVEQDGLIVVEPVGVVALGLVPIKPLRPAPLSSGDAMICHPLDVPVKVVDPASGQPKDITEIGFRCGEDVYQFRVLSITPK